MVSRLSGPRWADLPYLDALGSAPVGFFRCTTCIGNSGPLRNNHSSEAAIKKGFNKSARCCVR